MKISFAMLLALLVATAAASSGKKWVLLCAGSNTWSNYRHQADIYHMYQIASKNGIPDENIVVMHYDDIAHNKDNPTPGTVINKPGGDNVYVNVPKDFVGADVNPTNFLGALIGDKSKVKCTNSKSACRVIDSGADDEVFVYFADHGGTGIIGFQEKLLHAKDMLAALQTKYNNKGYSKLTFYMEACESGSMFESLAKDINVYALSASSPSESSWGFYCPGEPSPYAPPKNLNTCLGDLFSVNFLQDMDAMSSSETLQQQFAAVKTETGKSSESKDHPGIEGSQVMQWGDLSFTSDSVDEFVSTNSVRRGAPRVNMTADMKSTAVHSFDAELVSLQAAWKHSSEAEKQGRYNALVRYMKYRDVVDTTSAAVAANFASKLGTSSETLMRGVFVPSVQDTDCYKEMLAVFDVSCTAMGTYGRQRYSRMLANMCNKGVQPQQLAEQCRAL